MTVIGIHSDGFKSSSHESGNVRNLTEDRPDYFQSCYRGIKTSLYLKKGINSKKVTISNCEILHNKKK